ncbi:hypothetical protein pb186bvf_000668 [Paramecium bursaria]
MRSDQLLMLKINTIRNKQQLFSEQSQNFRSFLYYSGVLIEGNSYSNMIQYHVYEILINYSRHQNYMFKCCQMIKYHHSSKNLQVSNSFYRQCILLIQDVSAKPSRRQKCLIFKSKDNL